MSNSGLNCFHKGVNYRNKIIGGYEVLDCDGIKKFPSGQTQVYWKVRCISCNREKSLNFGKILGNYQSGCRACLSERFSGSNSHRWSGGFLVTNVPSMYFHKLKSSAEKRKINFDLTRDDLENKFIEQNGKCVYTNYDLHFGNNTIRGTASLDRIDSKLDYTISNVQWVHKDVNTIKWDLSHDRFIEICQIITERTTNAKCKE